MGLNAKQREAVIASRRRKTKHKAIAEQLGIDVRTLHRWQDDEYFNEEYRDLKNQLHVRVRNEFLAAREGRLSRKMRRHEMLTEMIEKRAEEDAVPGAGPVSVEQRRVDLALYRELSKLETEISKELDQNIQGTATPVVRKKKTDYSCLDNKEIDVLIMLNTKLAAINPAMDSKYYGKLSDDEIAKAEAHVLKMWNERSTSSSPARNRQPRLFATTEKTGKPNKKPKQTKRKTTNKQDISGHAKRKTQSSRRMSLKSLVR